MIEKRLTEIFYQEAIKRLPTCIYCANYATRICSFWEEPQRMYEGRSISNYSLCDICQAPKQKNIYKDYKIFSEKQWVELRKAVLEYEKYSKLDRVNRFI